MFNSKVPFGTKVTLGLTFINICMFTIFGLNGLMDQSVRTDSWMKIMLFSGVGLVAGANQAESKLKKIGMTFDDL